MCVSVCVRVCVCVLNVHVSREVCVGVYRCACMGDGVCVCVLSYSTIYGTIYRR